MNKTFRSSVAALVAAAGLMTIAVVPATASTKAKPAKTTKTVKISCYLFSSTTDQLSTRTVTTKACPTGYTQGTPTADQLQGTGNNGDIDLSVPSGVGTLNINGSSFDQPLVAATTSGTGAYPASGVNFSSYAAAGSGAGRTGIEAGTVNIGFSDQPISSSAGTLASSGSVAATTAEVQSNFVQVPYLLGGAVVGYNLGSGFDHLKLTAAEIASIYDGKITQWSDPTIVATNGGASSQLGKALTALGTNNEARNTIKVCYRSASSGTTYAFTDYLNAAGQSGHTASGSVMEGTGNKWGATNILAASNNAAMAQDLVNTLGSIGYVEYSYLLIPGNDAVQAAQLQDANGQWLDPTDTTMPVYVANAAAAAGNNITSETFSIVNEPGNKVWPLATYSWAIIWKNQSSAPGNPSAAQAEATVKYLDWEEHYAQVVDAANNGYVALPAAVAAYGRTQLAGVTYNGTELLNQTK